MIGGQVAVLNDKQWDKIERCMSNSTHKTMLAIMRLTACRSQEVRLLRVEDVYSDPKLRKLRKEIFFPAEIRKGKKRSLSVHINSKLTVYLQAYQPPTQGYLFPSPRNPSKPISYEAVYKYLKEKVDQAGLGHLKIGTHSGRRSLITSLAAKGVAVPVIMEISGHSSLASVQRYIEVSDDQKVNALELL